MAGIVLSDILNEVTSSNLEIRDATAGIGAAYGEAQKSNELQAQAILDAGGDAATVARTSEWGNLQAQNNAREAATHLGTNPEAANYKMLELSDQMLQSYDIANAQLDKIHAKKAVSPITDGPIKYLAAQLSLSSDVELQNYAAKKYNLASSALDNLNSATQQSTATQYAIAATRNAASVDAKADMELNKAKALAYNVKSQTAAYEVDKIKTVQAMNGQQLDNLSKGYNAQVAADQRELLNEQRKQIRADAHERLLLAQQGKGDWRDMASFANIGAQSLGMGQLSESFIRQKIAMGGKDKDEISKFVHIGMIRAATGNIVIGENAGDAAVMLNKTNAPLTAAQQQVKTFVQTAYSDAQKGAVPGADLKSQESVNFATQELVNTKAANMMKNIVAGDASNIYQAPDVQTIAQGNKAVAESALYQKLLRVQASSVPYFEANPENIARRALIGVKEGTITYQEAVQGITRMFTAATEINIANKGYDAMHVPSPEGGAYMVRIAPMGYGSTNAYNVANEQDVHRLLVLMQIDDQIDLNLFQDDPREYTGKKNGDK